MKELFNLTGKVAVVTGAGGVLCSEMAKTLAKAGAKVAVLDLMEEAAEKVADAINGTSKRSSQDRRQSMEDRRQEEKDRGEDADERRYRRDDRRETIRRYPSNIKAIAVKCSVLDKKQLEEA
jgi:NAD(P)-dependent dehydrogenase (short-subunit alcohol dehydrogenase family)